MKMITKVSLICAFAGAAGLIGGNYAYQKQQREKEIELLISGSICTVKHNYDGTLTSTVDVSGALAVSRNGEIGFNKTAATITIMDKDGISSHDFTFDFEGKGAICNENSPVCSTMESIPANEKKKLTDTICERAKDRGAHEFYQEICIPKP